MSRNQLAIFELSAPEPAEFCKPTAKKVRSIAEAIRLVEKKELATSYGPREWDVSTGRHQVHDLIADVNRAA